MLGLPGSKHQEACELEGVGFIPGTHARAQLTRASMTDPPGADMVFESIQSSTPTCNTGTRDSCSVPRPPRHGTPPPPTQSTNESDTCSSPERGSRCLATRPCRSRRGSSRCRFVCMAISRVRSRRPRRSSGRSRMSRAAMRNSNVINLAYLLLHQRLDRGLGASMRARVVSRGRKGRRSKELLLLVQPAHSYLIPFTSKAFPAKPEERSKSPALRPFCSTLS